jgi:hypothetical protein
VKNDPIVEEARRAGQEFLAQFKGDMHAAVKELNRLAEAEGIKLVYRVPRPAKPRKEARRAG